MRREFLCTGRIGLLILLVLGLATNASTQKPLSSTDRKALKRYESALDFYMKQSLEEAVLELETAVARDAAFVEAWLMLGQILEDLGQLSEAADALKMALDRNPRSYLRGHADLIRLLHAVGRYDEALETLEQVEAEEWLLAVRWEEGGLAKWHRTRESVRFAAHAFAHPRSVSPRPIPGEVNSIESEYGPALSLNALTLMFTREVWDGDHWHEDFYVSRRGSVEADWPEPTPLHGINTPGNEGAAAISGDGQFICFTACESPRFGYFDREGKGSCDLFASETNGQIHRFDLGENLGLPNTQSWESQPALSADGRTLIFSRTTHSGSAERHADLFMSQRVDQFSEWSVAVPLPGQVNTPGHEGNPMLHADGKTLYFVSDGHPGMGGDDLFVSRLQLDGEWGLPQNLGYPINTNADEGHLMVTAQGELAYFATDRNQAGNLDLWELNLPMEAKPSPVVALEGQVFDRTTGMGIGNAIVEVLDDAGTVLAQLRLKESRFTLPLPIEGKWWFRARHPQYEPSVSFFDRESGIQQYRVEIGLKPWKAGTQVILQNLRFESGSAMLKPGFQPDLDPVIDACHANPKLRLAIIGHTDDTGTAAENDVLSLRRAHAVKNYLMKQGIDGSRLETKGMGSRSPIASNESLSGRALNRRTELLVLGEGE
ncbi:MAG: OmpA family protein [Flavobacteriales bacterium]